MNNIQPDIHECARQHPPMKLPDDMRERLLAAMLQEEADCAADDALERELLKQYFPTPLPADMQQRLIPARRFWRRTTQWRYVGSAAAALALGGVALTLLQPQAAHTPKVSISQQRQAEDATSTQQDTFILETNDDQGRVVIRVLSHNTAQLTDDVI